MAEIVFNPYNLNPLMRNVLITNAEVIFHAPTKHTLDPRMIQQGIIIAEERFIRPALGFKMYEQLVNTKNVVVNDDNRTTLQSRITSGIILRNNQIVNSYLLLSTADQSLWLQILWKLVAECVLLSSLTDSWVQVGSEGVVLNAPTSTPLGGGSNLTSPDLSSMKFIIDKKMMDRIDPLLTALQNFICYYKTSYPFYTQCPTAEVLDNQNGKRTEWITGIYDQPDKPCDWDITTNIELQTEGGPNAPFIFV